MTERNYSFDFLKGLGCLAIITLHTGIFAWVNEYVGFLFNTLTRFAVPIFFMISGYLFFRNINKEGYFKKYIFKIIKVYIIALVAYLVVDLIFRKMTPGRPLFLAEWKNGQSNPNVTIGDLLISIFGDGDLTCSSFAMWYILALIYSITAIYLICRKNIFRIKWILLIGIILNLIGMFGGQQSYQIFFSYNFPLSTTRDALHYGLLYLSLGAYVSMQKNHIEEKKKGLKYLKLSILFMLLLILERGVLVYIFKAPLGDFYLSNIPLAYCMLKFGINYIDFSSNNIIVKIGQKSLGVYLAHTVVIAAVYYITYSLSPNCYKSIIYNLVIVPVVASISYLLAVIFGKVKSSFKNINISIGQ